MKGHWLGYVIAFVIGYVVATSGIGKRVTGG